MYGSAWFDSSSPAQGVPCLSVRINFERNHTMSQQQMRVHAPVGDEIGRTTQSAAGQSRPSEIHYQNVEEVREREDPDAFELARDRVRWGPIVAGLLTALTALLLLSLLGLAIGLTTVNAGAAATQGGPPPDTGRNSAIWAAISGVVAFALGGYVAGRTAALFNRGWGALNGALVFMLAVPLTLWLAGQGLGTILGSLGTLSGEFASNPNAAQAAQGAASQAQSAAQNAQAGDIARAAEAARNTAWGTLAGSLVAVAAGTLGGWLGTRHPAAHARARTRVIR
jgi:hypothetical protein